MSAMNALLGKPASQYNGIEYCIVKTWTNPADVDERMSEKAAAEYLEKNIELLALRERVEKMAVILQWIYDDGEGGTYRPDIVAALVAHNQSQ